MNRRVLIVLLSVSLMCTGCSLAENAYDALTGGEVITEEQAAQQLDAVSSYNENFKAKEGATEFIFNGAPITGKQHYEDIPAGTKKVVLFITDELYYPVYVPDYLSIITDNCSYIYSEDETLSVSVVSGIDPDHFAASLGIRNVESLSSNLVITPEKAKGPRQAALHVINDKALVVRTYDNDVAFNKVIEGLQTGKCIKPINLSPTITDGTRVLTEFPKKYTGFISTVNAGLGDSLQRMYSYEGGCLTVTKQVRKFDDAKKFLDAIAITAAGTAEASVIYQTDNLYYVEVRDITYAVMRLNYNTSLTCYGIGEEARFNVVEFVNYQR